MFVHKAPGPSPTAGSGNHSSISYTKVQVQILTHTNTHTHTNQEYTQSNKSKKDVTGSKYSPRVNILPPCTVNLGVNVESLHMSQAHQLQNVYPCLISLV